MSRHETDLDIPSSVLSMLREGCQRGSPLTPKEVHRMMDGIHSCYKDAVLSWAFTLVSKKIYKELSNLAEHSEGLHFNIKNAQLGHAEDSFMGDVANRMRDKASWTWKLISGLLEPQDLRSQSRSGSQVYEGVAITVLQHKGEVDDEENMEKPDEREQPPKVEHCTGTKLSNAALKIIKAVVCMSIFLNSINRRCNHLQSLIGIFLHSALVPEKVIELLSHAGISTGLTSIHSAVESLSNHASINLWNSVRTLTTAFAYDNFDMSFKVSEPTVHRESAFISATSATAIPLFGVERRDALRCSEQLWERDPNNRRSAAPFIMDENAIDHYYDRCGSLVEDNSRCAMLQRLAWHVRDILVQHSPAFNKYKDRLGTPKPVNCIPVHKTEQIPCRAMNIKESTPDGNMSVMENLLSQGGLGEAGSGGFNTALGDIDMSDWVLLVHGDLLTKERLESVKRTRRIEDTPKRRFQYVVFVPGLFHFEMACADAIWRTWVQPNDARKDSNSMYNHAGILRPNELGKFGSKPGYRRTHQVIHHDVWAAMLDCWAIEARAENDQYMTLEAFASAEPSWETIERLSEHIVAKYVGSVSTICKERRMQEQDRDKVFENQLLRNRDELLYLELHHAIKAGDIGRVEETFVYWISIFKSTGKHEYAHHMLLMMMNLQHLYPPELCHIIRMNWLCNPTGKVNGFRGVDWLVERNNLYTKVIYGGARPNRTLERVIEESILIEFYRKCHVIMENGFYLTHRTINHTPPDMTHTLQKLSKEFLKNSPHRYTPGRDAYYKAPDKIYLGLCEVQESGAGSYDGTCQGSAASGLGGGADMEIDETIGLDSVDEPVDNEMDPKGRRDGEERSYDEWNELNQELEMDDLAIE